jgi:hypothetical protein
VHLTDFGIARLTDVTAITARGFVIGTAAYLAPEQVTGEAATPASDVYALGLVLLEVITGERAYEGSPSEAALARLNRQPEIPPTTSGPLGALLGAMTAADPTLRPSASAAADVLRASVHEGPADATAVLPIVSDATMAVPIPVAAAPVAAAPVAASAPSPVAGPRRRGPLIAAALIALLLLLLLLGSAFGGGGSGTPVIAETSTTVAPPTTAAPPVVSETVPPAPEPAPEKKKGKHGDG